jgi:phosphatidylserine/phosphatidylglycerophosphate/cardiolipin synthase-like enzyme
MLGCGRQAARSMARVLLIPQCKLEARAVRTHSSINGPQAIRSMRRIAEQALSRTSGAPLIEHNRVRILSDAAGNYPAWLGAIRAAKRFVHFENYIFQEDTIGREFAQALTAKAREGVTVRVVRDWLGSWRCAWRGFWRAMSAAGVQVRCFNPPRLDSPVGWITRDHAVPGFSADTPYAAVCATRPWSEKQNAGCALATVGGPSLARSRLRR